MKNRLFRWVFSAFILSSLCSVVLMENSAEAAAPGRVILIDGIDKGAFGTGSIFGTSSTAYLNAEIDSANRRDITATIGIIQPFYWTNDAFYTNDAVHNLTSIMRSAYTETSASGAPLVVVAHSWGTVLAYIVLEKNPDIVVDKLITMGSPLSVSPIDLDPRRAAIGYFTTEKLALQFIFQIDALPNALSWHNYWTNCDLVSASIPAIGGSNIDVNSSANNISDCHSWYFKNASTWNSILADVLATPHPIQFQGPSYVNVLSNATFTATGLIDGNPASLLEWDLDGDGIYEYEGQTATSDIFLNPQTLNITLRANGNEAYKVSKTLQVTPLPISVGCDVGMTKNFSTPSTPLVNVTEYQWTFGDLTEPHTGRTTSHEYTTIGEYTVNLTATFTDPYDGSTKQTSNSTTIYAGPGYQYIYGHTIYGDEEWCAGTYRVISNITVSEGATLTIPPGTRLEIDPWVGFTIYGTLVATEVTFTWADGVNQWRGIFFSGVGSTNSRLENCAIEHADGNYETLPSAILVISQSSPIISGCTIGNSVASRGIMVDWDSFPEIRNNSISGMSGTGVEVWRNSSPIVTGNTITGSNVGISISGNGGTYQGNTMSDNADGIYVVYSALNLAMSGNVYTNNHDADIYVDGGVIRTWMNWDDAIVYRLSSLAVAQGATLVIEHDRTVRLNSGAGIAVNGTLMATGVTFTWADGVNQWRGIFFSGVGSTNSRLENCAIEHADGNYEILPSAILVISQSSPIISGCTIGNSVASRGIMVDWDSFPEIRNNSISGMSGTGVEVWRNSSPIVTGNTITGSNVGISISGNGGTYSNNAFQGNTSYGLYFSGTGILDATSSNWGDPSGPLDNSDDRATGGLYNPTGLGNNVSDHVNYYPWTGMTGIGSTAVPTGLAGTPGRNSVNLAWDANPESWVGGYKIYYGTTSGAYGTPVVTSAVPWRQVTGLSNGTTCFLAISSLNSVGVESEKSAEITVTPDGTPPTGSVVINDGTASTGSGTVTLTLAATDANGIARMCISNTSSCTTWESFTATKSWTLAAGDGAKTVYVWYEDTPGNQSSVYTDSIILDTTPPDTSIASKPLNPTTATTATFTFSATEGGSTFECSLDTAAFSACTSPANYSGLDEGSHTFKVRGIDPVGNVDPTPASWTWAIDLTPPDTTIIANPPALSNSPSAAFTFSANEGGATFECSLDNVAFSACTSPKTYTGLAQGAHDFKVRAKDGAGNTDPTPAAWAWSVDSIPPDTSITSGPENPSLSVDATFTFTAGEVGCAFECSLDSAAWASCSSPVTLTRLARGGHSFAVRATDPAGNTDPTPASQSLTVGANNAPELAAIGNQAVNEGAPLIFTLTAEDPDPGETLTFSATNLPPGAILDPATGSFSWTPGFDQAGDWTVTFAVADNADPPLSDSETVTITVTNVNGPPVLEPVGDQFVNLGDTLDFTLAASDPDDDPLAYAISYLPDGAAFDTATGHFTWTPTVEQVADYPDIVFSVTDNAIPPHSVSETITITVHDPVLFTDDFSDGNRSGDMHWTVKSGIWSVINKGKNYASSYLKYNLSTVAAIDPVTSPFIAGRISARIKMTTLYTTAPNASIVFAYRDPANYRYLRLKPGQVVIGQVGDTPGEAAGVKANLIRRKILAGQWYTLRMDLSAEGLASAYLNGATTPLASYAFKDMVPGGVGCRAQKAKSLFDNITVWDETILPAQ